MNALVLVVDIAGSPGGPAAETDIGEQLAACGFHVRAARDFESAAALLHRQRPDGVVVYAGSRRAREYEDVLWTMEGAPLAVAIDTNDADLVIGWLEAGADTVLACPLSKRELAARVNAVMGRPARAIRPSARVRPARTAARAG